MIPAPICIWNLKRCHLESKDEFRQKLKQQCPNGGGSRGRMGWGCPCCVPFRVVGRANGRQLMRRAARHRIKAQDRKDWGDGLNW